MDLATYAIEARKTAVFNPIYHVTYPALGLVDETAEFVEKWLDFDAKSEDIVKEAGDCAWYFNCVCDYSDLRITDFFKFQRVTSPTNFLIVAGKIAGVAKKAARDNNGTVDKNKLIPLLEEYSAALLHLISGNEFDITLEEVLERNIAKLRDRQQRGVIKGNGDNR